jgi:hypothetical protein
MSFTHKNSQHNDAGSIMIDMLQKFSKTLQYSRCLQRPLDGKRWKIKQSQLFIYLFDHKGAGTKDKGTGTKDKGTGSILFNPDNTVSYTFHTEEELETTPGKKAYGNHDKDQSLVERNFWYLIRTMYSKTQPKNQLPIAKFTIIITFEDDHGGNQYIHEPPHEINNNKYCLPYELGRICEEEEQCLYPNLHTLVRYSKIENGSNYIFGGDNIIFTFRCNFEGPPITATPWIPNEVSLTKWEKTLASVYVLNDYIRSQDVTTKFITLITPKHGIQVIIKYGEAIRNDKLSQDIQSPEAAIVQISVEKEDLSKLIQKEDYNYVHDIKKNEERDMKNGNNTKSHKFYVSDLIVRLKSEIIEPNNAPPLKSLSHMSLYEKDLVYILSFSILDQGCYNQPS